MRSISVPTRSREDERGGSGILGGRKTGELGEYSICEVVRG